MFVGSYIITWIDSIPEDQNLPLWHDGHFIVTWSLFLCLTVFHLLFNYLAVSSVVLQTLNSQRLEILITNFLKQVEEGTSPPTVLTPSECAQRESILFWHLRKVVKAYDPTKIGIGVRFQELACMCNTVQLERLLEDLKTNDYVTVLTHQGVLVGLKPSADQNTQLRAFFHSHCLIQWQKNKKNEENVAAEEELFGVFRQSLDANGWLPPNISWEIPDAGFRIDISKRKNE
jgi:hypothetical protein